MITIIAAMAQNRVIGLNGKMPWHLPEDLQFFKKKTMGCPMIMGRKTRESFGKSPLPSRPHLVITGDQNYQAEGSEIFYTPEKALEYAHQQYPDKEIFIIGGATIYSQMLNKAHRIILSEIKKNFPGDRTFPEFDVRQYTKSKIADYHGASIPFTIYQYIRSINN